MNKLKGSIETLNALQLTKDIQWLDEQSKTVLHSKEILAVILQGTIEEYKGYSRKEIMEFIEKDSINEAKEVSVGRTNTEIQGECAEFVQLNEKTSRFDIVFRAKNPALSDENVLFSLHVDIEPQKTYKPGYPIEKRGIYYLARRLSSQLSLITEKTDYKQLEKCYSIWVCRDDIPPKARYSVSFYRMANIKNIGENTALPQDYDLMSLVVIKLGEKDYKETKENPEYELLHFLNIIMYPHKADFMDEISRYIDFSENEELWEEVTGMEGLGQCILEEGIEQGMERGIRALILDHLEEKIPREKSIAKLQKHFGLEEEDARHYYEKYGAENQCQRGECGAGI